MTRKKYKNSGNNSEYHSTPGGKKNEREDSNRKSSNNSDSCKKMMGSTNSHYDNDPKSNNSNFRHTGNQPYSFNSNSYGSKGNAHYNYERGRGRGYVFKHSENNQRDLNSKESSKKNMSIKTNTKSDNHFDYDCQGFMSDYDYMKSDRNLTNFKSQPGNYISGNRGSRQYYNHERGGSSDFQKNVSDSNSENFGPEHSWNNQRDSGFNESRKNMSTENTELRYQETFKNGYSVNSIKNYGNNIRYETEKSFFAKINQENSKSMNSEYGIGGNSSEVEKPVPLPRTSVNKSEKEDSKGARKKLKGGSDEEQANSWFCMNCEKILVKSKNYHIKENRNHEVYPIDIAIQNLKEKQQNKILNAIEEANTQLETEKQTKDIINLYDNSICPSLANVFKELKVSNADNIDKLHEIQDSGTRVLNNNSVDYITNILKLMDFKNNSHDLITQNEKLLSDLKQNSCWLIFSWFKISIGLFIQSGLKVFACMNSHKSLPAYAPFDLSGDRLQLFSFKRGITPNKTSHILPFESISSLLKNEDSKSFMVIMNDKQEGHVTMRIHKEKFWGQQFIALCLGYLGPSLRNTRFFRSSGKGKPGHHIWGGDYSKNDGSGGEAFLPWNEPFKQSPEPIVKGLISARYGSSDRSTVFRIYVSGEQQTSLDQPTKENFCFGYVEEGMETLEFFANQSDITKTIIKDAGCFLTLK